MVPGATTGGGSEVDAGGVVVLDVGGGLVAPDEIAKQDGQGLGQLKRVRSNVALIELDSSSLCHSCLFSLL